MSQRKTRTVESSPSEEVDTRRRVGFLISAENDFKLTVFARKKRKDRSTVIDEALSELLRGIVISFRGKASEEGEAA